MSSLDVPGARIYHEVHGDGPVLLCISGADGSCDIWRGFAESLKEQFKVILWDRRGFSRSILTDSQDYSQRLERDADDAAALLEKYSPNEPATVIGNSSGAIVSLKLLCRHADKIRTLLCYEPPAARFLEDFDQIWTTHHEIYNTYRSHGMHPAFVKFAELTHSNSRMATMLLDPERSTPTTFSNMQYWFEREFMVYPQAEFDVEKDLAPSKEKLVLVNGEDSPRAAYQFRGNVELGKMLGLEPALFPGEHVAHATHAKSFAERLVAVLREKDEFYRKS